MEYGTQIKVATITLWNFLAIVVNIIAFAVIYNKANKNQSLRAFFVVHIAMIIWLVGKVLKTVSPNVELRWFFIVFYYFGICLLEASFLNFSYIYYKRKPMKKNIRNLIYFIALIQFIVVLTNPRHYLFYSRFGFWGDDFGILFYFHVVINYSFFIIGAIMCSIRFRQQIKNKSRLEKNIISIAIITPLLFNFIYITRVLESFFDYLGIQIFDITPIVYTWSILLFVYATFKYEFFELSHILKSEIVKKIDMPILIIDNKLNILFSNAIFDKLFKDIDFVLKSIKIDIKNTETFCYNNKFYRYSVDKHSCFEGEVYILGLTDITAYEITKNALDKENKELLVANTKLENQIEMLKQSSMIGARNFFARELHDVVGHSLVVTIKLLEVCKIYYKTNKERVLESLDKAMDSINTGFSEMKYIKNKDRSNLYNTKTFEKEIRNMLKMIDENEIDVNFYVRGKHIKLDEKTYDSLKRIVTELITNTLKHANASKLLLNILLKEDSLVLQTMDNGVGIDEIVKGNGLNGIDKRLSLINGRAKYTSEKNDGFSSNIIIDLKAISE